jgi:glucuronate isomerase
MRRITRSTEVRGIFGKIRAGEELTAHEKLQFKSAMMMEFGSMDAERGWVQQLHLGGAAEPLHPPV